MAFALATITLATAAVAVEHTAKPTARPTAKPTVRSAKLRPGANESAIERGRKLAIFGGCVDCHTPGALFGASDFSRQLSGSELGWSGPWATRLRAQPHARSRDGTRLLQRKGDHPRAAQRQAPGREADASAHAVAEHSHAERGGHARARGLSAEHSTGSRIGTSSLPNRGRDSSAKFLPITTIASRIETASALSGRREVPGRWMTDRARYWFPWIQATMPSATAESCAAASAVSAPEATASLRSLE